MQLLRDQSKGQQMVLIVRIKDNKFFHIPIQKLFPELKKRTTPNVLNPASVMITEKLTYMMK